MVGDTGFRTSSISACKAGVSRIELIAQIFISLEKWWVVQCDLKSCDQLIKSQLLYQLS